MAFSSIVFYAQQGDAPDLATCASPNLRSIFPNFRRDDPPEIRKVLTLLDNPPPLAYLRFRSRARHGDPGRWAALVHRIADKQNYVGYKIMNKMSV